MNFWECLEKTTYFSIILTILFRIIDRRRSLIAEINDDISELFDFYYEKLKKTDTKGDEIYSVRVQYMSKLERMARKVNSHCLQKQVKKQAGQFLLRQNEEFISEYIQQRRKQFHRENYYENTEKLLARLKK